MRGELLSSVWVTHVRHSAVLPARFGENGHEALSESFSCGRSCDYRKWKCRGLITRAITCSTQSQTLLVVLGNWHSKWDLDVWWFILLSVQLVFYMSWRDKQEDIFRSSSYPIFHCPVWDSPCQSWSEYQCLLSECIYLYTITYQCVVLKQCNFDF